VHTSNNDLLAQNRIFAWLAAATGAVLLIPFIAMQFSEDVVWSLGDFIVAGLLIFGTGALFVLAARMTRIHRAILAGVLALAFLWLWVELAVGLFTDWGS
jgi:hypothetical protein